MRLASLFKKTMIENFRDWKIIILTLTFAPFFVVLMYFYVEETGQRPYKVLVVNRDEGAPIPGMGQVNAGEELIAAMSAATHSEGNKILDVQPADDVDEARERLTSKDVDLVVEIPEQFSQVLLEYQQGHEPPPTVVRTYGDPANVRYIMAAVWSDMITFEVTAALSGMVSPLELEAKTVRGAETLSDFELYVPAMLALALMMLMFTCAASLIKEKDKGTLIRLRISNMTNAEWLGAVSLVQVIIGLLSMAVTFLTAVALGYRFSGSLVAVTMVGLLSSVAMIAISLLVAAWLRTIFDLMTIGCFPFFILMFFSGGMFPLPPLRLLTIGGRSFDINEILPTTHSIAAFDKILNVNMGLGEVAYELAAIAVLTVVFYVLGAWLFARRHLRPA
jgi:ABC-2 type transport system permease protein